MEIGQRMQAILQKVEQVQAKMAELKAENAALREEKLVLTEKLQQAKAVVVQDKLEIASEVPGKEDVGRRALSEQDIRQQIDRYISEIDKCIEWLTTQ